MLQYQKSKKKFDLSKALASYEEFEQQNTILISRDLEFWQLKSTRPASTWPSRPAGILVSRSAYFLWASPFVINWPKHGSASSTNNWADRLREASDSGVGRSTCPLSSTRMSCKFAMRPCCCSAVTLAAQACGTPTKYAKIVYSESN